MTEKFLNQNVFYIKMLSKVGNFRYNHFFRKGFLGCFLNRKFLTPTPIFDVCAKKTDFLLSLLIKMVRSGNSFILCEILYQMAFRIFKIGSVLKEKNRFPWSHVTASLALFGLFHVEFSQSKAWKIGAGVKNWRCKKQPRKLLRKKWLHLKLPTLLIILI